MGLLDNLANDPQAQFGIGLLGNKGNFGQGLQAGFDRMNAMEQQRQMQQMQQMRMGMMQDQIAAQKVAKERRDAFRATLPEQYQNLPDELLDEYLKASMQPKKPYVVGRSLIDDTGKVIGTDETWKSEQEANRVSKAEEARQRQQERMDMFNMQRQDRRDMFSMNADLRREMAGQRDALAGKPPVGFRFTPDGNLEAIPGGPADLKAQATAQRQADGATDVDVAITGLRDAYDRLEKGGGITSTKNNALSNIAASTSSSSFGQCIGKMFGTQNQSARNDIAMGRPALLAALMKATGMSAKQMDSNAELKLWLTTATDPTLDVEANRRALDNIEKKYLRAPVSKPEKTIKRTGMYGGKKVIEYTDGSVDYAD